MNFNDRIKVFKRAMARNGLFAVTWVVGKLSYAGMQAITKVFMSIGFLFVIRHKRVATESLHIAFGDEKTDEEVSQIFKDCFVNLGKGMMEMIYFANHLDMIREKFIFEGKEHLDEALKKGNGAIMVTAHFGNFPLMLVRCAQEGYDTNAIIRRTRDVDVEKYFLDMRTRMGVKTVYSHPRQECVANSIKALRNNGILCIPLDQNFGSGGGVYVDFFGRKAATATGPAVFAMRTKAPIIPMFVVRNDDDTHKIIIEPPIDFEEKEDDKETIFVNTSKITKIIEKYIRRYPQEWGWMHRRWKTRPR